MSTVPLSRPAEPIEPCALPRHEVGRRVQFVECFTTVVGTVVQHFDRQLVIRRDDGSITETSCGHVAAARMAEAIAARWPR